MRIPSLNALRCVEAVARLGGVTRAASELNLTQSAVSHQLIELEKTLGTDLFKRERGRLIPTPTCRRLSREITHALRHLTDAIAAVHVPGAEDANLTVSMLPSVATKWLVPRLAAFIESYPEIKLSITASRHFTDFSREKVDAAIRYGRGRWPGLETRLLGGEDVLPVCSPGYAAGMGLKTTADLDRATLLHGDIPDDWDLWRRRVAADGFEPQRGLHFTEDSALIQAAIEGLGVALGRSVLVHDDLRAGRLIAPFTQRIEAQFQYWFVWPSKAPEKRPRTELLAWLRDEFARCREA